MRIGSAKEREVFISLIHHRERRERGDFELDYTILHSACSANSAVNTRLSVIWLFDMFRTDG